MKKWILLLLSATVLSAAKPDAKTEKEVLAAMDAYKQALLKKDAAALSKVLSDDLIYTHSSNLHEDKTAVLDRLADRSRHNPDWNTAVLHDAGREQLTAPAQWPLPHNPIQVSVLGSGGDSHATLARICCSSPERSRTIMLKSPLPAPPESRSTNARM